MFLDFFEVKINLIEKYKGALKIFILINEGGSTESLKRATRKQKSRDQKVALISKKLQKWARSLSFWRLSDLKKKAQKVFSLI